MRQGGNGIPAVTLVIIGTLIFGFIIWQNTRPEAPTRVIVPTEIQPATEVNAWQVILEQGFGSDSTPLPTIGIPTAPFVPPTLPIETESALLPAQTLSAFDAAQVTPFIGATPTPPLPTAPVIETVIPLTQIYVTQPPQSWQPPPLIPPLSRDLLGRDHYWMQRPIDSNANNRGLFYYPYGSDGPEGENYRIHAGIDMPNQIGEPVRAAGSGTVVWAADGLRTSGGAFQDTYSYGNVVVIQHDFGYRGRSVFTLYAHLALVNVVPGQRVETGDVVGLVGNTGRVTGPHVHFEVRLGDAGSSSVPHYANTYNPALWMVPYVGTGVIAGRVTNASGQLVMDADVTVRSRATGQVVSTTTTYIYQNSGVDVNADPEWQENFVIGDVPVGRHEVVADIGGQRVSVIVNVVEGTTTFVELSPSTTPTNDGGS
ncbi:MAG: peptidoglycan DD-metalloendopeptidase family protein [Anaerolineae bacterium]|nr:peptidoglycan DD-metalloendopeptidase family protein [Anaerolineae bacterium]